MLPSQLMNAIAQITQNPWMSVYLRLLAVVFLYTGSVHVANIAGFGEMPWRDSPMAWQIGDVVYGLLDFAVVVGLWQHKAWGVICFLIAIASQWILYTVFIDAFALTAEHRQIIHVLLIEEAIAVGIFGLLWWSGK